MQKSYKLLFLILIFSFAIFVKFAAAEVVVKLNNGKQISGKIVSEESDYILLDTMYGELKLMRSDIENIADAPFSEFIQTEQDTTILNDQVVVHLKSGKLIDGFLIAKSRTMIMVQTEMGRLSIPKSDVQKVEYVSTPFAEKGEAVILELTSGKKITGYMESETYNSLTLTTEVGKLTIDKDNLRSITYDVPVKFQREDEEDKYQFSQEKKETPYDLDQESDGIGIGYSSSFGKEYERGIVISYKRRQQIAKLKNFSLNLEGSLDLTLFGINEDFYQESGIPGSVTIEGYAFLPSLSLGVPLFLQSQLGESYRFFFSPQVDFILVNKSLDIQYPSFPSSNREESSTDFRFGVSAHVGMEWKLTPGWSVSVGYKPRLVFNDENYGATYLYVGTKLY
jgi:small nuclear ribonucleoprotein (snRNP)-like protein